MAHLPQMERTTVSQLKPAAQRVQDALSACGLDTKVRHMAQTTRTAEEAAAACGCAVGQIVKSLVFRGATSGKPYLLLVSGANRVDEKAAGRRIGETLKRPDAQYVRDVTGFAIGGIPPLGHATPLATYMDEALLGYDVVWAAAGTPDAVFPVAPARLVEAAGASVIPVG
jgi:prolyl-tRNA editing enzyme YbaK/EbsC (Cys-tRNA(Pro) deacylase)